MNFKTAAGTSCLDCSKYSTEFAKRNDKDALVLNCPEAVKALPQERDQQALHEWPRSLAVGSPAQKALDACVVPASFRTLMCAEVRPRMPQAEHIGLPSQGVRLAGRSHCPPPEHQVGGLHPAAPQRSLAPGDVEAPGCNWISGFGGKDWVAGVSQRL